MGRQPTDSSPQIEIRRGRTAAAWTDTHDWVGLSDLVEPPAHSLYVKLKMHLNQRRGDALCWPGKNSLAEMMTYAKVDTLDRYIDQLEAVGAIDVDRRGMPGRCYYTVNDLPGDRYCTTSGQVLTGDVERCRAHAQAAEVCPAGPYTGPLTLGQWYERHAAAIEARDAAAKAKRDRQRAKVRTKKAQVNADTPHSGYQDGPALDTPYSGYLDTPYSGDPDTPYTGAEQERIEQERIEQKEGHRPPPPNRAADVAAPEGEAGEPGRNQTADALLGEVILDGVPATRRPRGRLRARILAGLTDALTAGWHPDQLGAALAGSWDGAGHIGAVLESRVRELLAEPVPPPPRPAAAAAPTRPAVPCTVEGCDSPRGGIGLVEVDGGGVRPCPTCRPAQAAKWTGHTTPGIAGHGLPKYAAAAS